jgi:hypothetical protein
MMHSRLRHSSKQPLSREGQSLAELLLCAAMIGLVALGGLTIFGKGFASHSSQTATRLLKGGVAQAAGEGNTSPSLPLASSQLNNTTNAPQAVERTIYATLADGSTLEIANFKESTLDPAEYAGLNGSTTNAVDTIKLLAQTLSEQGKLTKPQSDALINLSEQGYKLARIQKDIDALAEKHSQMPTSDFLKLPLTSEGKTLTVNEWKNELNGQGIEKPQYDSVNFSNPDSLLNYSKNVTPDTRNNQLGQFIGLYEKANKRGALQDPVVADLVKNLVFDVSFNTDTVAGFLHRYHDNTPVGQSIESYVDASKTQNPSSDICDLGEGRNQSWSCE